MRERKHEVAPSGWDVLVRQQDEDEDVDEDCERERPSDANEFKSVVVSLERVLVCSCPESENVRATPSAYVSGPGMTQYNVLRAFI